MIARIDLYGVPVATEQKATNPDGPEALFHAMFVVFRRSKTPPNGGSGTLRMK